MCCWSDSREKNENNKKNPDTKYIKRQKVKAAVLTLTSTGVRGEEELDKPQQRGGGKEGVATNIKKENLPIKKMKRIRKATGTWFLQNFGY